MFAFHNHPIPAAMDAFLLLQKTNKYHHQFQLLFEFVQRGGRVLELAAGQRVGKLPGRPLPDVTEPVELVLQPVRPAELLAALLQLAPAFADLIGAAQDAASAAASGAGSAAALADGGGDADDIISIRHRRANSREQRAERRRENDDPKDLWSG